jgi:hypothetical protein
LISVNKGEISSQPKPSALAPEVRHKNARECPHWVRSGSWPNDPVAIAKMVCDFGDYWIPAYAEMTNGIVGIEL